MTISLPSGRPMDVMSWMAQSLRLTVRTRLEGGAVTAAKWTTVAGSLAGCVIAVVAPPAAPPRIAPAKNGDTHVIGQGLDQVLDCNDATLIVNGPNNSVTALGNC